MVIDFEISAGPGDGGVYLGCFDADSTVNANPIATWWPLRQEIVMVNVLTGAVQRLAHHRSRQADLYCRQPRVSANWDGTKVMFASNYGVTSGLAPVGDPSSDANLSFHGDRKADLAVIRPTNGLWYILRPSDGSVQQVQWGSGDDIPVPADYDGDDKAEVAVFRPQHLADLAVCRQACGRGLRRRREDGRGGVSSVGGPLVHPALERQRHDPGQLRHLERHPGAGRLRR